MKATLKLEELCMLLGCIYAMVFYDAAWWWYLLLLMGPDISMPGYLAGPKAGAVSYNVFHHKGIGIALIIGGFAFQHPTFYLVGFVVIGHSSLDRMMGYGLKYFKGFQFTHLGKIGKEKGD